MSNVLNEDQVTKFCEYVAKGRRPHVAAWLTSTLRRFILQEWPTRKEVIEERVLNSTLFTAMAAIMNHDRKKPIDVRYVVAKTMHIVDRKDLPEWAVNCLNDDVKMEFIELPEIAANSVEYQKIRHWADFLETLPEREIRHSIGDLTKAVVKWDADRRREKILGSMQDGVIMVESAVIAETNKYFMVELIEPAAYKREGTMMQHCVWNSRYDKRKGCRIFSLRHLEKPDGQPICTIEITRGRLVQAMAYDDEPVSKKIRDLVNAWCAESSFSEEEEAYDEDGNIIDGDEAEYDLDDFTCQPAHDDEVTGETVEHVLEHVPPKYVIPALRAGAVTALHGVPIDLNVELFPPGAIPTLTRGVLGWEPSETVGSYAYRLLKLNSKYPQDIPQSKKRSIDLALHILRVEIVEINRERARIYNGADRRERNWAARMEERAERRRERQEWA
jgi:hypothetical protein